MSSVIEFKNSSEPCPHCLDEDGAVCMPAASTLQKEDCAYCFCTPAHGTGLFICMCCHESVCEEHIPKHRATHKDTGSHCLYTKISRLPPRLTDEDVIQPPAYDYRVVCVDCNCYFPSAVYSPDVDGGQREGTFETTFGLVNAALKAIVHTASVAGADAKVDTSYAIPHVDYDSLTQNEKESLHRDRTPQHSSRGPRQEYSNFMILPPDYRTICDVDEHGTSTLKPAYGANALTGMHNFGNTCYLSSVMQVLISTSPDFRRAFLDGKHIERCATKAPRDCFRCQLEKFATAVYSDRFSKDPSQFADAYDASRGLSAQSVAAQEDAIRAFKAAVADEGAKDADDLLKSTAVRPRQDRLPASVVNGITPRDLKRVLAHGRDTYLSTKLQNAREFITHVLALSRAMVAADRDATTPVDPTYSTRVECVKREMCVECECVAYNRFVRDTYPVGSPIRGWEIAHPSGFGWSELAPRPRIELDSVLKTYTASQLWDDRCDDCGGREGSVFTKYPGNLPEVFVFDVDRYYYDEGTDNTVKVNMQVVPTRTVDLSYLKKPNTLQEGEEPLEKNNGVAQYISDPNVLELVEGGYDRDEAAWAVQKIRSSNVSVHEILRNRRDAIHNGEDVEEIPECIPEEPTALSDVVVKGSYDSAEGNHPGKNPNSKKNKKKCDKKSDDASSPGGVQKMKFGPNAVVYQLVAIISHVGSTSRTGHYVCHIRKPKSTVTSEALHQSGAASTADDDDDDYCWVSYNDEKVGVTTKPPFEYADLYFYSRVA